MDFSVVNPDKDLISYTYAKKGTAVYHPGLPVLAGVYIIQAVNMVTDEKAETAALF